MCMLSLLNSCGLLTLHPIFTEKDLVFDARILGTWKTGNGVVIQYARASKNELGELSEVFKQQSDKIYLMKRKDPDGRETKYYAFLVKLGPDYYFDYYPTTVDRTGKIDEFYAVHHVRLHAISRVDIVSNASIKIAEFDDSYMKKLIDAKNIRIRREQLGKDKFLVTASTDELKQYIIKYGDVPEAYGGSAVEYSKIP